MQTEQKIDRAALELEAARWGREDFFTGSRKKDCPYSDPDLALIWLMGYDICQARASKFERGVAWLARLARTKVFK